MNIQSIDITKSPTKYYAESGGEQVPVMLTWKEINVIKALRRMQYGDLTVNISKGDIMKIKPNVSMVPTTEDALEFLQNEENKYNYNKYGSKKN